MRSYKQEPFLCPVYAIFFFSKHTFRYFRCLLFPKFPISVLKPGGLFEGLLDLLSKAAGGDSFVAALKDLVSNADRGIINRSIGMLQSHRTGVK